jgi:hypothetical protein
MILFKAYGSSPPHNRRREGEGVREREGGSDTMCNRLHTLQRTAFYLGGKKNEGKCEGGTMEEGKTSREEIMVLQESLY